MIISAAAFGRRTGWGEDDVPPGHRMSFKRAIGQVGTGILVRVLCPKWIFEWGPIETIRECRDSFDELRVRSLRARPRVCALLMRSNSARTVVFVGVDRRAEVL